MRAADAAGLPTAVIDELSAVDAARSLGLAAASGGERYEVLFRTTRAFGAPRAVAETLALSRDDRLVWRAAGR